MARAGTQSALQRLKYTLGIMAAIFVISVVGFRVIEGWSWFDAVYMVVLTMGTVGYREVHELSPAGRWFNLFVMIFGVGSVLFSFGMLTQTLLEFELRKVFGKKRMQREIDQLTGHYLLCGAGQIGQTTARELEHAEVPFVVIENPGKHVEARSSEWLVVEGDATQVPVLQQAGIERAAGLVAAHSDDAKNIYIVITARRLNPNLRIIARASHDGAEVPLRTAGADSVFAPYRTAGRRVAQYFLRPHVAEFLDIAEDHDLRTEMVIEEIEVKPGSRLAGVAVGASKLHHELGIMVLAIRRDGSPPRFNPRADEVIRAHDNLIVMGAAERMPTLEKIAGGTLT